MGDLNAKTPALGCKKLDHSGVILNRAIYELSLVFHNNNVPTYRKFNSDYEEILDLMISSPNLSNDLLNFQVLDLDSMGSDHSPIVISLKSTQMNMTNLNNKKIRLNFSKADWVGYRSFLEFTASNSNGSYLNSLSCNQLNKLISGHIMDAVEKNIPKYVDKGCLSLPTDILGLIKERREIRKLMRKNKSDFLKKSLNKLTFKIKTSINLHREKVWSKFLNELGPYPTSSKKFWEKINQVKSKKTSNSFPKLIKEKVEYKSDEDKATLFANLLQNIYKDNKFDSEYDISFRNEVSDYLANIVFTDDSFLPFTTYEIYTLLKNIKVDTSPGSDEIQNIFLKKLPYEFIDKYLRILVNKVVKEGIPDTWKSAKIIMIPKENRSSDPDKYRPISLTSCLGKLVERLVKIRLNSFLEENDLIVKQQSGFRNGKGAEDNLIFFTQKISESLNKGKKAVGIFFDISKAFDKVWHQGLIYKLYKMGVPNYITRYEIPFLN